MQIIIIIFTLRDFNFLWAESIIIFAQWKQDAEC